MEFYTGEDSSIGQILPAHVGANDMQMGQFAGADDSDPAYVVEDGEEVINFDGDDFAFDVDSDTDPSDLNFGGNMCLVACVKLRGATPLTSGHSFIWRARGFVSTEEQYGLRVTSQSPNRRQMLWSSGPTIRIVELIENTIPIGTWFTLIGSVSNSPDDQELYENGVSIGTAAHAEIPQTREDLHTVVGAAAEGGPALFPERMDGHMAVATLYNVFKTSAQVRAIHNDIRDHFRGLGLPAA